MSGDLRTTIPEASRPGAILLPRLASVALGLVLVATSAAAQPPQQDPDWPCIQVLVPQIASGQIWTGPPVDSLEQPRSEDREVRDLALELAARRTPLDQAEERVAAFAASLEPEVKDEKLTALFAGVLQTINRDRASLISGIKRFAAKQRALGAQIQQATATLRELSPTGTPEEQARHAALQEEREWAIRILDERENSLTYLCEQPVLLERRAFALAREIAGHLG